VSPCADLRARQPETIPPCGSGVLLAVDAARKLHAGLHQGAPLAVPGLEPGTRRSWVGHSDETGDAACQWTGPEFRRGGVEGRRRKTPIAYADGRCVEKPCLTLLGSRRSGRNDSRGRSPDLRIILLANAFPAVVLPPVASSVGVRPRSQWRVREGITPSSQYAPSRAVVMVNNWVSHHVSDVKPFLGVAEIST
jgi:hypothetical protein